MSEANSLSLLTVDSRLEVLHDNLLTLQAAAQTLGKHSRTGDPLEFQWLAQAFSEEAIHLRAMMDGSPDDRYAALDSVINNLATIRTEADDEILEEIDTLVAGELKKWD